MACDLSKVDRRKRIEEEGRRFAEKGIVYEAWSARSIMHKLRSAPAIVARCLGNEYWFERIVGQKMPAYAGGELTGTGLSGAGAMTVQQIEALRPFATAGIAHDLDEARALSRKGREREALARLDRVQADPAVWALMEPRDRARALRLRAGVLLRERRELAEAKKLAQEAERLDPAGALRLKALIAEREAGPEAGLQVLGTDVREEIAQARASFLLRLGRAPEALAVLERFREETQDASETRRLRAVAKLVTGDRVGAERDARDALRLAPEERLARHTLAITLYCCALSPAAPLANFVAWPDPVDWTLVRRDDEAIKNLNEAEMLFTNLLPLELPDLERRELQGWRLACLANVPSRRVEAEDYCRALFGEDPTHPSAVAWALARNLPLRPGATRKALRDLLATGSGEVVHVLALAGLLLSAKHHRKALQLLDREKLRFVGVEPLWVAWRAQAIAMGSSGVWPIEGPEGPARGHLAALVASLDTDKERGERRLAEIAADMGGPDGSALVLLDTLERLAQRRRWDLVAPHAGRLVAAVETAEAIRLSAYALAETGRDAEAAQILTERQPAFPGGELPGDLRRLRIECNVNAGQVTEAIREAEEIASGSSSPDDLLKLTELYLTKGDLQGASKAVRSFKRRADIPAEQSLRLSQHLILDDPQLARELLLQATEGGLADHLLSTAFTLALRLGIETDLRSISERMFALASSGQAPGLVAVSFDDVLAMMKERRERAERMEELYRSGAIPIQLLSQPGGASLAELYHSRLEARERDRTWRGEFLLTRYGGKRSPEEFPPSSSELKLHLDVTAVLLAEHVGILDAVEARFRPLRIPVDLTPALLEMRDAIAPHQRDWIDAEKDIIRLFEDGRITAVDAPRVEAPTAPEVTDEVARWLARRALDNGGAVVSYVEPDPSVPPGLSERFLNCRGLLEILRTAGPLSEPQYQQALLALGVEGQRVPRLSPLELGKPLYFHRGTIATLSRIGLLELVCDRFSMNLETSELDNARARIAGADQADRLVSWLSRLVERIQRGVDAGTYIHIPRSSGRAAELPEARNNHAVQALLSLLAIEPQSGGIVWLDDRALSSYSNANGAAILGVTEILRALHHYEAIDADQHFRFLLKLRAAHVRYIPLEPGELAHHLRAAPVHSGAVFETSELGTIRRYFGACLLQEDFLQLPPVREGVPIKEGEIWFAVGFERAIHEAILNV